MDPQPPSGAPPPLSGTSGPGVYGSSQDSFAQDPTFGMGASYAKADLGKRFLAYLVDGLLAGVLGIIPYLGPILGGAYLLLRDGLALDFADGRSIGKKLLKLRPVRLDGAPMTLEASARRNWPFALGALGSLLVSIGSGFLGLLVAGAGSVLFLLECVLVLTDERGRRIGDKTGDTQVVVVPD